MRKEQQQILCSSDVSIAGKIDSHLQVKRLSAVLPSSFSGSLHRIQFQSSRGCYKWLFCYLVSDTGSSSSEDEGPKKPKTGPGARNGEVRRRRTRTPSPRRRHRDASPRSVKVGVWKGVGLPRLTRTICFVFQEKTFTLSWRSQTSLPFSPAAPQISLPS